MEVVKTEENSTLSIGKYYSLKYVLLLKNFIFPDLRYLFQDVPADNTLVFKNTLIFFKRI